MGGNFNAVDESGAVIGRLRVELDANGDAPRAVRDQHGTTWVRDPGTSWGYQRVRCSNATLEVTP